MKKYRIISDSTADLNVDIIKKYNIEVIPMEVKMGEETFMHEADFKNKSVKDFYQELRDGALPTTSQINPARFVKYFKPFLEVGENILYICFSSGLSSTYESFCLALNELKEEYPDNELCGVDSLAASAGEGLMVYYACKNQEKGMSVKENADWLNENKQHFAHWFTVDDLNHLYRGGRVSKGAALIGGALSIKPVLHVDEKGHLINVSKAHGRKKAIANLLNKLEETGINIQDQTIFISHGDCYEDALLLKNKIIDNTHAKEVIISDIGPVVGAHSGPGTLALFFFGEFR